MVDSLGDDHRLAASIATEAGRLLLALRTELAEADPELVRQRGDNGSHLFIAGTLAAERPGDAILSEEAPEELSRLGASRVWIVDPLDGTREFGEPARVDWAVHVALVVEGRLAAGAVALPARNLTLSTADPPVVPSMPPRSPRLVVSRTRPPDVCAAVADRLGAEAVPLGSAGAKAMAVVMGEADIYLHAGGQYEWDSAAPVAVATAARLHVSRLDGSPLRYNQPSPWLPDLVVCRPDLAEAVLAAAQG